MTMIVSETQGLEFAARAQHSHRLSPLRLGATGAAAATIVFVLCWLGTLIPIGGFAHAYIGLFATAEPSSGAALLQGTLASLLFGALAGGLIAGLYNLFAGLERRS